MARKRLLTVGTANIDFLLKTPYVPSCGETVISEGEYAYVPGEKGANAAVAAARLGSEVVFCTRVGDDAYGDRLLRLYAENGVDSRYIKVDCAEQTGLAIVMLERTGDNRIIVFPGANRNINDTDIENSFLSYPDAVLTQFECGEKQVLTAARISAEQGLPLFIDAGPATPDFPLSKLQRVEVFSPNETETAVLTGIRPNTPDDCLRASIKLCSKVDMKYVVLKLGERGAFIYDGKYCDIIEGYEVNAIDTTAAGDAFTAALAVEYLRTGDIYTAVKYGNAVGALTTTKVGALNSLPREAEVRKFMADQETE
ncbi:MAG: bifunctional hydroxymethylpyrimidine kinase/phosphomethylpyrimidine kinase [Clostridia bacterium]|nr:bifunctional hydroxymethylpyrimidine kinase/phosphomethylpyrimidine kinase [Clostridia bacterium]